MNEKYVLLTDEETKLTLQHDTGPVFEGAPGTVANRGAVIVPIDKDVPNGHGATLTIDRKDYTLIEHGVLWLDRKNPVTGSVGFDADTFEVKVKGNRPFVGSPLPRLVVNGQFFGLADGGRWSAIECSDFNLLARFLNQEDIEPVLTQRAEIGFNLLRVWTLMDLAQYGIGRLMIEEHHELYDSIREFCALCASYGMYVEFTAYTGINDPQHWTRLCEAAKACDTSPLLELVNELDQNTNEPDHLGRVFRLEDYQQPSGLLSAHGSNGSQAQPVLPHWSYATFHTNDAPGEARKVGHNAFEIWDGPTLTNETTRCPKYTNPRFAFDCAAGAALLCAGSCFHSVNGKRSQLFDLTEETCARAWVAGATSVPLDCQAGGYRHRDDLEPPNAGATNARTYQRGSDDRCIVKIGPS